MSRSEDSNGDLPSIGNQDLLELHDGGVGSQTLVDIILMAILNGFLDGFLDWIVSHGEGKVVAKMALSGPSCWSYQPIALGTKTGELQTTKKGGDGVNEDFTTSMQK